jgi:2-oxoglutarate dehydrogenase E2 component (dihydrolipoamide succinyltransferase)
MVLEMKMPSPGESITEVEIAQWLVEDGEYVERDQIICEIDSEKATLELAAEDSGAVQIVAQEGETVDVGSVVCKIDTSAKGEAKAKPAEPTPTEAPAAAVEEAKPESTPAVEEKTSVASGHPSPAAKKRMDEAGIKPGSVSGTGKGGRVTKGDVLQLLSGEKGGFGGSRDMDRKKMSSLRKKLAKRLVSVKNETAMLTTFNEVDMSAVMGLRTQYKKQFQETHGVKLGFMSFFTKAVTEALALFPAVNAMIDGEEIVYHQYADVGIAVSSPKGLMVPVLRNAEVMGLAEIEGTIMELAGKARNGKLTMDEMTGGTFTITNGGIFGSMMSTPIINPPQSAILGMHNIVQRPVAIDGNVEIRPMMYLALSYDHRIIDGRESVGFLVKVKEMLEEPVKMLTQAKDPGALLLGL